HSFAKNTDNKHILTDIVDNTDADQFDLHDGLLEKNLITDKFMDSIGAVRKTIPEMRPTDRFPLTDRSVSPRGSSKTDEETDDVPKEKRYHKFINSFSPHSRDKKTQLKTARDEPVVEYKSSPKAPFLQSEPIIEYKSSPKAPFLRDEPVVKDKSSPKTSFLRDDEPPKTDKGKDHIKKITLDLTEVKIEK